jgi:hypothetical protein
MPRVRERFGGQQHTVYQHVASLGQLTFEPVCPSSHLVSIRRLFVGIAELTTIECTTAEHGIKKTELHDVSYSAIETMG